MIQKGYVIKTDKDKVIIDRTDTGIEVQTSGVDGLITTRYTYATLADMKEVFEMILYDIEKV